MDRSLEPLDIKDTSGIHEWHIKFEQYVKTIEKIDDDNKTVHYITLIGKQAFRFLMDLAYPSDVTAMKVTNLKDLLHQYLSRISIQIFERKNSTICLKGLMNRTILSYEFRNRLLDVNSAQI